MQIHEGILRTSVDVDRAINGAMRFGVLANPRKEGHRIFRREFFHALRPRSGWYLTVSLGGVDDGYRH
jgi:hypothetical protein